MIGEVLDDTYRVVERLGAGAMGEVYLVEHVHIGRREAIKVLRPEMAADQRLASRFRREARAINRLRHPNIIGIYDFGQLPDGRLYLTMEYAHGEQLDAALRREGRFDVPRALALLHQMASAIDHAHAHGVVHRDLKPGNMVLVDERGHRDALKILDFGLAKVMNPGGGQDELTLRGELFGTPEYMAPERLGDAADDPRSDLYSLGCIAHELLTGKPPFTGSRPLVMAAHMTQTAPPPGRSVAGVPPMLDAVIGQLLAKDPSVRLQSGAQLCAALEQVPGYPRKRGPLRSGVIMTSSTLPPGGDARAHHAGAVEVHDELTLGDRARAPRQIAFADTASARTDEVRDEILGALVELAQAVVDHDRGAPGNGHGNGTGDGVAIALALVHAVRDDRARIGNERVELEERQARALQNAREREGSLRFAIAELRYDRGRTPAELHKDLDFQVSQLEARVKDLADELRRDLDQIDDRGIELAAREHDLEAQWVSVHARLREALAAHLAAGGTEALRGRFLIVGTAAEEMLALGGTFR